MDVILALPRRGVKGLPDCHRKVVPRLMVDTQIAPRNREIDPHIERAAPVVMVDGAFHHDVTAADAVIQVLKLCDLRSNLGFR